MEERGFVRLECPKCGRKDQWLRCEKCRKSDHFVVAGGKVLCDCGASYDHGTCACGQAVPVAGLVPVRWDDGPKALADLEIAWGRIAALGIGVLALILGGMYWFLVRT